MQHLLRTATASVFSFVLLVSACIGADTTNSAPADRSADSKETAVSADQQLPTLYLVGDSTVKNGTRGQVGWGTPLADLFDRKRIRIENRALGGRSSRSYLREGLWQKVVGALKPGDFVLIQFGHNDNGPIAEGKARASLKGNGDDTTDVVLAETGQLETVHSFGWYLRKYITETKAKGATPIVCSLVPRNIWKESKVVRGSPGHGEWAAEAARQAGALFIDLNEIVAARYEKDGPELVRSRYFTSADHTHTSAEGARLNADCVVEGIKRLANCDLSRYLAGALDSGSISAAGLSN